MSEKSTESNKKERAYELDMLRGFAIFMMVLMHFAYDVRYEFGCDVFRFLRANWFWSFVHPFFLVIFVGISGVCCTFSRNNFKRGFKLLAVAMLFTAGTVIATKFMGIDCLIIFNVLHLLSLSILVYAIIEAIQNKIKLNEKLMLALLTFAGTFITALAADIGYMDYSTTNLFWLPVGFKIMGTPEQADHMFIIPWLGVFLIGVVVGKVCYADRKSLVPKLNEYVRTKLKFISVPLEFMGKHSLIVYIVHQPIVYGILYVIFMIIRG